MAQTKTILTIALTLLMAATVFAASVTVQDGDLYADGKIGIGTLSPGVKLTIRNPIAGTVFSIRNIADAIDTFTVTNTGIVSTLNGSAAAPTYTFLADPDNGMYSTGTNTLNFTTGGTERFRITSIGNVGIGTATPTSRLMSNYATTVNPSLTWNSFAPVNFRDENSELVMGLSATSPFPYYMQARSAFSTAVNLAINPLGGNVGIGTTSPAANLNVFNSATSGILPLGEFGSNGATRLTVSSSGNLGSDAGLFFDPTGGPGNEMAIVGKKTGNNLVGELRIVYPTSTGDFVNPTTTIMTLLSGGNVGIGTSSPAATLHVAGEARISGISADGTGKVVCIKSTGDLGTCTSTVSLLGVCTCT